MKDDKSLASAPVAENANPFLFEAVGGLKAPAVDRPITCSCMIGCLGMCGSCVACVAASPDSPIDEV